MASFPGVTFPESHVAGLLEVSELTLYPVLFEEDAMPKLEVLQLGRCNIFGHDAEVNAFSRLSVLTRLKEIRLDSHLQESVKEEAGRQVAEHMKYLPNIIDS